MASAPVNVNQKSIIDVATVHLESNGCNAAETLNFLVKIRGDKEDIARAAIQYALDSAFSRGETIEDAFCGAGDQPACVTSAIPEVNNNPGRDFTKINKSVYPTSILDWALW